MVQVMEAAGQVAVKHGLTASWHPQPLDGQAYSGMHLHWSVWQVGMRLGLPMRQQLAGSILLQAPLASA